MSRLEIHRRAGIRATTVGQDINRLLSQGLLREGRSEGRAGQRVGVRGGGGGGRGRPRVPLEIDPDKLQVIGLTLSPIGANLAKLNLLGQPAESIWLGNKALPEIASELSQRIDPRTWAVGLAVTGFVDPLRRVVPPSALSPKQELSLEPLYQAVGDKPLVVQNDMQALAGRWVLTHQIAQTQDVLLVQLLDGQVGAAMLIGGRPNHGCIHGCNELGHTRLPVTSPAPATCYCGGIGCLERLFSSEYLKQLNPASGDLSQALAEPTLSPEVQTILGYLAMSLSNAVNLTRVNRLVLVSPYLESQALADRLISSVRQGLLNDLRSRVAIDLWNQPAQTPGENAGWLALASVYCDGWS